MTQRPKEGRLWRWLASLGVGLLPGPQGTYGSLMVAGLAWVWLVLGGAPLAGPQYWLALTGLCLLALGASALALRARCFGPGDDPGQIVIDEAAGMLLALHGQAAAGWRLLAAFAAFRLFDILKPWPVGWSQRLPGAWGVVADDLLAGLYSLLALGLLDLLTA